MSIESDALNKLAQGRGYILYYAEYVASTLLEMTPIIVPYKGVTMGITKGLVLYVNGEWLLNDPELNPTEPGSNPDEVLGACLYHEVEHPLRGFDRIEALPNGDLANIAGDEAINYNLREEGWKLPTWVVYPEKFNHPPGLTMEQYYELLSRQMQQQQQQLQQFMNCAMGGNPPPNPDTDSDKGKKGKGEQQPESGTGSGQGWQKKIGAGTCGSGAGSTLFDHIEQELDAQYGKSEAEVDAIRRTTLDRIEEHMQQFGRGSVPGRFEQLIQTKIKAPEVDWRRELKRVLRRSKEIVAGCSDFSMRNPSIGGALVGVTSSGVVSQRVLVAIAEDTSLSMGTDQLIEARSEGYHLLKKMGLQEAWLIQADTQVERCERISLRKMPSISYKGRGGTNFIPVFQKVMQLRPRPNLLVFFTDGAGPAPEHQPRGLEVVWCIVRTPYSCRPAPWGKMVVCDKRQEVQDPFSGNYRT
jgi:predicted metal-dependent peptidase